MSATMIPLTKPSSNMFVKILSIKVALYSVILVGFCISGIHFHTSILQILNYSKLLPLMLYESLLSLCNQFSETATISNLIFKLSKHNSVLSKLFFKLLALV